MLAAALVFATARAQDNWTLAAYGSAPDSDIVNSGEVKVCKSQPETTAVGNSSCSSNLDCGSALCISVEMDGTTSNQCGCGNFERMINSEMVTICSCDYVGDLHMDACLPIWKHSIMCKFACKNCFTCEEKNPEHCANDAYCEMSGTGGEVECADKSTPDEPSAFCHKDKTAEECEADTQCRMGKTFLPGGYNIGDQLSCMDRTSVLINPTDDTNARCPVSMERKVDAYMGEPGNFFDTCVSTSNPDLEIKNCKYYEWDGDSCKTCIHGYALGMVALKEGNGRIKQNAICYDEAVAVNNNCEVFVHDDEKYGGMSHHACARCKDGFEYPLLDDGTVSTTFQCEAEYIENSSTHFVDPRILLGAFGAAALLGAARHMGRFPFAKLPAVPDSAWNTQEAEVELSMSE